MTNEKTSKAISDESSLFLCNVITKSHTFKEIKEIKILPINLSGQRSSKGQVAKNNHNSKVIL